MSDPSGYLVSFAFPSSPNKIGKKRSGGETIDTKVMGNKTSSLPSSSLGRKERKGIKGFLDN